jgi:hypothetical protein
MEMDVFFLSAFLRRQTQSSPRPAILSLIRFVMVPSQVVGHLKVFLMSTFFAVTLGSI